MRDTYYLIDSQLSVKPVTSFLAQRGAGRDMSILPVDWGEGKVLGNATGPPLPITADGELNPGVLYESSSGPQVRFYLPEYRLNLVDGRYTSSLKWRSENDDPNGPLAFLTVEVLAVAPPAPPPIHFINGVYHCGYALQEIPHQVLASIVYEMPMQDGPPGGTGAAADSPRPVLRIEVGALNPMDGGVRRARLPISSKPDFDRLYQVMTDSGFNSHLQIRCFATAGRRTWRQIVTGNIGLNTQTLALKNKGVLFTDLVTTKVMQAPVEASKAGPNARRLDLASQPDERLQLNQAMKLANTPVTELVRENNSADLPPATVTKLALNLDAVKTASPNLFRNISSGAPSIASAPSSAPVTSRVTQPMAVPLKTTFSSFAVRPGAVVTPMPAIQPIKTSPPVSTIVESAALKEAVVQPVLLRAFARPIRQAIDNSDVVTKVGPVKERAVPAKAVVSDDGSPALIQIPVETCQEINPFSFLPDTNGYMFDIPDDMRPGSHHILIRSEVRNGDGQVIGVFYQDSAYTDQFYYQPEEFLLPRLDSPPYLPDLRVLFFNLVTKDDDGGDNTATLNYRVQLVYRVLPHIDPLLLDLAQQQFPQVKAHFNALIPETTTLTLKVPEDETGGNLTDVPRLGVEVRFDQGIVDQLELSRTEFERIFVTFTSGGGMEGAVEAGLLGNQTARVPVRVSFEKTTGSVFGRTYLGPQGGGIHRVRMNNRIESPVTIDSLYRVALGGGVFAFPQSSPGIVVQPGGQVDIDYRVDPPDAPVVDISPSLSTVIDVDPNRLWPQLFINQGYTSDTFSVHVTIEPDFFGIVPPGESEPLTGVQVEFEDGAAATLTTDRLQTDVQLHIPLLPRLLGNPQAKRYRYRVSNLLGTENRTGAMTDWSDGEGETPLEVHPAGS
jgi:hypothetical protein